MRIHLHCPVKNDERILPYFFRHYDKYVEKYFFYYNIFSKDRTLDILKSHSNVTIINDNSKKLDERYLKELKCTTWKNYTNIENCDWVIICDTDEFLYNEDLIELLKKYDREKITFPKVKGYQMYCDSFPDDNCEKQIYELIKKGIEAKNYDKFAIFKPNIFPNYSFGCHFANPVGVGLNINSEPEIKLLHYKIFGKEFVSKMMERQNDLSEFNKSQGMGVYSLDPNHKFNPQKEYEYVRDNCKEVI